MRRMLTGLVGVTAVLLLSGCSAPASGSGAEGTTPADFIVGKWSCVSYQNGEKTGPTTTFDVTDHDVTISSSGATFHASYSIVGDTLTGKVMKDSSIGQPGQSGTITSFPVAMPGIGKKVAITFTSDGTDVVSHATAYRDGKGNVFIEGGDGNIGGGVAKCSK